jgi:hypothetical protein
VKGKEKETHAVSFTKVVKNIIEQCPDITESWR